jgi:hypothetical protein
VRLLVRSSFERCGVLSWPIIRDLLPFVAVCVPVLPVGNHPASDKSLYVLLPSSEASGVSHSSGAWLGVSGVGNTILGPYDDPRSTAQPLKAINPYDKSQVQNAALLEERRRAQIVDPRECAVLMGVSQRSPGPIKGATLVTMAVQSIQRFVCCCFHVSLRGRPLPLRPRGAVVTVFSCYGR